MFNNLDELKIFLKFSVVGVSGALVDLGTLTLLYKVLAVPLNLAVALAFCLAVVNNYTWNILWTYSHQDHSAQHHVTLSKFVAVSIVGLLINEAIVTLMTAALGEAAWLFAKLIAMGIVMFWN
ncbi:MAG: GtrA family protein, partial [Chloroflexi bacterium]|nr:GtrA family protein [Chloroflexota bacterium]